MARTRVNVFNKEDNLRLHYPRTDNTTITKRPQLIKKIKEGLLEIEKDNRPFRKYHNIL